MANVLTDLQPQILAQILETLRSANTLPSLVNNSYSTQAASKGATIDINDIADMTAYDVVAGDAPDANNVSDVTGSKRQLQLNRWKEVIFRFTDKEMMEIREGTEQSALSKAVKALADQVNLDLLKEAYYHAYNTVGTQGATPFGTSILEAQQAARILSSNLAPKNDRYLVLDPYAYFNALGLPNMQNVNQAGSQDPLRNAMIPFTMGFNWVEDQQVPTHTSTAASGATAYDVAGAQVAGATTLIIDDGSGGVTGGDPKAGDLFTIAGDSQVYAVTAVSESLTAWTLSIEPALQANASDNAAVTFSTVTGTPHVANLAFQRNAIGFASRPSGDMSTGGEIIQEINDPVSGLSMMYEIKRYHARTIFRVCMLYGIVVTRPSHLVRVFG